MLTNLTRISLIAILLSVHPPTMAGSSSSSSSGGSRSSSSGGGSRSSSGGSGGSSLRSSTSAAAIARATRTSGGIARVSSATVLGAAAAGARSGSYNIQRISATRPYSRFSPSIGGNPQKQSFAQRQMNLGASRVAGAVQSHTWQTNLLDPTNPYFWLFYSYFNDDGREIANRNMTLNDRIIEQSALIEHCLENAKAHELPVELCLDASYDIRVDLTGILSKNVIGSWYWWSSYDLKLATAPAGEDNVITKTNESYQPDMVLQGKIFLSLNLSANELIAALDGSDLFLRIGDDEHDAVKIDIFPLLREKTEKPSQLEVPGRFRAQLSINKIFPQNVPLSENLTQPLGLDIESVKNCARFVLEMGGDPQICVQTLEVISLSGSDLKSRGLYFSLFNEREPSILHNTEEDHVAKKMNLTRIMSLFYERDYSLKAWQLPQYKYLSFVSGTFWPTVQCVFPLASLGKEQITCKTDDDSLTLRLITERKNVFAIEARDLLANYEDEETVEFSDKLEAELEKLGNPYQVAALRVYVLAQKYYPELIEDLLSLVRTENDLHLIEVAVQGDSPDGRSLKKIRDYLNGNGQRR